MFFISFHSFFFLKGKSLVYDGEVFFLRNAQLPFRSWPWQNGRRFIRRRLKCALKQKRITLCHFTARQPRAPRVNSVLKVCQCGEGNTWHLWRIASRWVQGKKPCWVFKASVLQFDLSTVSQVTSTQCTLLSFQLVCLFLLLGRPLFLFNECSTLNTCNIFISVDIYKIGDNKHEGLLLLLWKTTEKNKMELNEAIKRLAG